MKKVDFGCGTSKRKGFIGVDILPLPGVDIVHDLNKFPFPFREDEIDFVWMDQILEHVDKPLKVVEEIYRVCKSGARYYVGVPYFRSYYATIDPTHKNFFGVNWFNYFNPNHNFCKKYQYSHARFRVDRIEFDREWRGVKRSFLKSKIIKFAEKHPDLYESRFSHLYPLDSLTFYLTSVKE